MTGIRQADFPADTATVARLFDGYIGFLLRRVEEPEERAAIVTKYSPEYRAEALQEFARLHVPPAGAQRPRASQLHRRATDARPAGGRLTRGRASPMNRNGDGRGRAAGRRPPGRGECGG